MSDAQFCNKYICLYVICKNCLRLCDVKTFYIPMSRIPPSSGEIVASSGKGECEALYISVNIVHMLVLANGKMVLLRHPQSLPNGKTSAERLACIRLVLPAKVTVTTPRITYLRSIDIPYIYTHVQAYICIYIFFVCSSSSFSAFDCASSLLLYIYRNSGRRSFAVLKLTD